MPDTQSFIWYELMTTDVKAAEAFYAAVVGWRPESFGGSAMNYTVMNAADRGTAGLMLLPEEAKAMGTPPVLGRLHLRQRRRRSGRRASRRPAARCIARPPTSPTSAGSRSSPTRKGRRSC